jgi:hypothetical protein
MGHERPPFLGCSLLLRWAGIKAALAPCKSADPPTGGLMPHIRCERWLGIVPLLAFDFWV